MENKNYKIEKGISLSLVAYMLLQQAGIYLKSDGKYYKNKSKRLLDALLNDSKDIFYNIDNLRRLAIPKNILRKVEKEMGYEVEEEVMNEELTTSQKIFTNLVTLYMTSDTSQLYDLELYTTNLVNKKKLYTEEMVEDLIKNLKK